VRFAYVADIVFISVHRWCTDFFVT